jgi:hypothetical protein
MGDLLFYRQASLLPRYYRQASCKPPCKLRFIALLALRLAKDNIKHVTSQGLQSRPFNFYIMLQNDIGFLATKRRECTVTIPPPNFEHHEAHKSHVPEVNKHMDECCVNEYDALGLVSSSMLEYTMISYFCKILQLECRVK